MTQRSDHTRAESVTADAEVGPSPSAPDESAADSPDNPADRGSAEAELAIPFTIDSALLRQLGERLVGRPAIALAELVKNSYDAVRRS